MLAHHLYTIRPPPTHPCPAAIRHCHAGSRRAYGPKDRLVTLQGLQQLHADAVLTSWSLPRPHGFPHVQAGEHTGGPSHERRLGPPLPLEIGVGQGCSPFVQPEDQGWGTSGGHFTNFGQRFFGGCEAPRAGRGCRAPFCPHPKLTHAARTVPVTWARGWWKPCSWAACCRAPGPWGIPGSKEASPTFTVTAWGHRSPLALLPTNRHHSLFKTCNRLTQGTPAPARVLGCTYS